MRGWWGAWGLGRTGQAYWEIGPLRLWVWQLPDEWRIAYRYTEEPLDSALLLPNGEVPVVHPDATQLRFGSGTATSSLTLAPVAADRPVVVRPETPFHILPGDRVRFFVGTPLQVRVSAPEIDVATGQPVLERLREVIQIACFRLSDTWFGPDTTEGELCYASRTSARLEREQLLHPPGRAITQVTVHNEAPGTLAFARLKVPLPRLAIYSDSDGHLWTSSISVRRAADGSIAELAIGDGPGDDVADVERLSEPQERQPESGRLARAITALVGS